MTQAPTAQEEQHRPGGPASRRTGAWALRRWIAPATAALLPIVLALGVGALILLVLGADPGAFYYNIVRRGLLSWIGPAGHHHPLRAAAAARCEPDRRLPRGPLEPRHRRPVPACRGDRRRAGAGSRHGAAGLAGAAARHAGGDGRGRRLVAAAGTAQGLSRGQRDRDHADDEFSGHQRRERPSSSCPSTTPPRPCRRPPRWRPTTACPGSSAAPSMWA